MNLPMNLIGKQTLETFALFLVGDGLVTLMQPRRHAALWRNAPEPIANAAAFFQQRPVLSGLVGVAEIGIGLWLASRQEPGMRRDALN